MSKLDAIETLLSHLVFGQCVYVDKTGFHTRNIVNAQKEIEKIVGKEKVLDILEILVNCYDCTSLANLEWHNRLLEEI